MDEQSEIPQQLEEEVKQDSQSFIPKTSSVAAEAKQSKLAKIKEFISECRRVLRITKKPNREEFKTIVKISGIGIIIIGVIGFLVHFLKEILF